MEREEVGGDVLWRGHRVAKQQEVGFLAEASEERKSFFDKSIAEEAAERGTPPKTVQEERFVILSARGMSVEDTALEVGISLATAYRWLKKKELAEGIAEVRSKIRAAGERKIQRHLDEAIDTLVDVMRTAKQDKDRLAAANSILDRGGLSVQELIQANQTGSQVIVKTEYINLDAEDPAARQAARAKLQRETYANQAIEATVVSRPVQSDSTGDTEGDGGAYA